MKQFSLLMVAISLSACVANPVLVRHGSGDLSGMRVLPQKLVFLLPPEVTYERVTDGAQLSWEDLKDKNALREDQLSSVIQGKLAERGFEVKQPGQLDGLSATETAVLLERLKENYRLLASSHKDKEPVRSLLKQLQDASGTETACLVTLRVRVGKGGGYEPFGGSMWQGTSSSDFKALFISLSTGEQIGRNEVYIRSLPTDLKVNESVKLLFQELEVDKRREKP